MAARGNGEIIYPAMPPRVRGVSLYRPADRSIMV